MKRRRFMQAIVAAPDAPSPLGATAETRAEGVPLLRASIRARRASLLANISAFRPEFCLIALGRWVVLRIFHASVVCLRFLPSVFNLVMFSARPQTSPARILAGSCHKQNGKPAG